MDLAELNAPHAGRRLGAQGRACRACAPGAPRRACSSRSTSRPTARRCRSTRSARSACRSRACCRSRSGTRSIVQAVDRAIREANLGLNPIVEGTLLRIPIPELNAERRQELVKVAHKYAEQARVAVRHVRRDGLDHLKKRREGRRHERGRDGKLARPDPEADRRDDRRDRRACSPTKEAEITQV